LAVDAAKRYGFAIFRPSFEEDRTCIYLRPKERTGLFAFVLAAVKPGLTMELVGGEIEVAVRRDRERVGSKIVS
jgi:hypothetical protein